MPLVLLHNAFRWGWNDRKQSAENRAADCQLQLSGTTQPKILHNSSHSLPPSGFFWGVGGLETFQRHLRWSNYTTNIYIFPKCVWFLLEVVQLHPTFQEHLRVVNGNLVFTLNVQIWIVFGVFMCSCSKLQACARCNGAFRRKNSLNFGTEWMNEWFHHYHPLRLIWRRTCGENSERSLFVFFHGHDCSCFTFFHPVKCIIKWYLIRG